jgi:hypothetical protein
MGSGKTSALINYINQSDDDVKFLYITPFLTEVARVIEKCPKKKFQQPKSYGTKINGIKVLFEKGTNIVSTHSLFRLFNQEIIDLVYNNNYVLVMDEVADVIEPLDISKDDLGTLLEKYTEITDGHLLKWTANEYIGEFERFKKLCELECVGIYNNHAILWLFPVSTFKGFREIFILTYLFHAQLQKYYFDFYNVGYNFLYIKGENVDNYALSDEPTFYKDMDYRPLINICGNEKLNQIGDLDNALSMTWYQRNKDNVLMKKIKDNVGNFFKHYTKTKTQLNLWTTFKEFQRLVEGKGYTKGYLSCNMRATNGYKDRVAVAYLINRYINPHIKNFFINNGIAVDEDAYALSEMIQFIWRSAIRDGNEIWLYCPSRRMRKLLQAWLDKMDNAA